MAVALKTPLVLVTDLDLVRASHENPGYRFEREEDGTVVVSPTRTKSGAKSLAAAAQLYNYKLQAGGNAYDSSTGFAIGPGKAVKSPDASWVSQERIEALPPDKTEGFWPLSPDVAIEVRSETDSFRQTVAKVDRFMKRGTRYAVAIDPTTREVIERGTPPDGLQLDFDAIIDA